MEPKTPRWGSAARLRGERPRRAAELYAIVMQLARERGLTCVHGLTSTDLVNGWPDVIVIGSQGLIFRKLLDEWNAPTREQLAVLASLRKAYCDAGLWRPQNLGGRIEAELDELDGRVPVVCKHCRRPYRPVHVRQLYCSSSCRIQHSNEARATAAEATAALAQP